MDGELVATLEGVSVNPWTPDRQVVLGGYRVPLGGTDDFFLDEVMIMPYAFDGENLY